MWRRMQRNGTLKFFLKCFRSKNKYHIQYACMHGWIVMMMREYAWNAMGMQWECNSVYIFLCNSVQFEWFAFIAFLECMSSSFSFPLHMLTRSHCLSCPSPLHSPVNLVVEINACEINEWGQSKWPRTRRLKWLASSERWTWMSDCLHI